MFQRHAAIVRLLEDGLSSADIRRELHLTDWQYDYAVHWTPPPIWAWLDTQTLPEFIQPLQLARKYFAWDDARVSIYEFKQLHHGDLQSVALWLVSHGYQQFSHSTYQKVNKVEEP